MLNGCLIRKNGHYSVSNKPRCCYYAMGPTTQWLSRQTIIEVFTIMPCCFFWESRHHSINWKLVRRGLDEEELGCNTQEGWCGWQGLDYIVSCHCIQLKISKLTSFSILLHSLDIFPNFVFVFIILKILTIFFCSCRKAAVCYSKKGQR